MWACPSSVEAQRSPSPAGAAGDGTRRGHVDEALQEDGDAIKCSSVTSPRSCPRTCARGPELPPLWKAQATPKPTQPRRFERVRSRQPTADPADAAVVATRATSGTRSLSARSPPRTGSASATNIGAAQEHGRAAWIQLVAAAFRRKTRGVVGPPCGAVLFGVGIWLLLTWDGAGKIATGLATLIVVLA